MKWRCRREIKGRFWRDGSLSVPLLSSLSQSNPTLHYLDWVATCVGGRQVLGDGWQQTELVPTFPPSELDKTLRNGINEVLVKNQRKLPRDSLKGYLWASEKGSSDWLLPWVLRTWPESSQLLSQRLLAFSVKWGRWLEVGAHGWGEGERAVSMIEVLYAQVWK
jgi:hypothetical protein